jgi:hypothetical protein
MGRGLALLMSTAVAGALAIPLVFLSSVFLFFSFGMPSALYLSMSWLTGLVMVILTIGILLRRVLPNDASIRSVEVSDESQKKPQPVAFKESS